MRERRLHRELWVPRRREEVFAFFANAENLNEMTPPWLDFHIETPTPIAMRAGAGIAYRLRLRGVPVRWRTAITNWEPPARFVDEQSSGPYSLWIHEHRFEEERGGTRIIDDVRYRVPGWLVEPLVHRLLVGPDLERIFDYRKERMLARFGHASE